MPGTYFHGVCIFSHLTGRGVKCGDIFCLFRRANSKVCCFSLHRGKKNKAQHNAAFLANLNCCNIEDGVRGGGGRGGGGGG